MARQHIGDAESKNFADRNFVNNGDFDSWFSRKYSNKNFEDEM